MPIRQPNGVGMPARSPARISVVAPSTTAVRPDAVKCTVPP
jgi:hypothetical protein